MNIWTFWEPKNSIPYYLKLCMETWKKYLPIGDTIKVLDYKNIQEYIDMDFYGQNLFSGKYTLPKIADAIRALLLYKHGGLWLDADTIMLNESVKEYFIEDKDKVMFFGDPKGRNVHLAIIYAPPESECMKEWAHYCKNIIESTNGTGKWSEMGNDFINPYVKTHMEEIEICSAVGHKPEFKNKPIECNDQEAYKEYYFYKSKHLNEVETDLIILHNSWTPENFKKLSEKEFLRLDCTMANVLRETLAMHPTLNLISFPMFDRNNSDSEYRQEIIFLGRETANIYEKKWVLFDYKKDIFIVKRNHGYNFYRYNIPQGKRRYIISLNGVYANFDKYSAGIYDFKNKKVIHYDVCKVGETVYFDFIVGEHASDIAFCVYAGLYGYTHDKELKIGEMAVRAFSLDNTSEQVSQHNKNALQPFLYCGNDMGWLGNSSGVLQEVRKNLKIKKKSHGFNYVQIDLPNVSRKYSIRIKITKASFDMYTAGIYDFKNHKILHYENCRVGENACFNFITGEQVENVAFLIYAGLYQYTHDKSLDIDKLEIFTLPFIGDKDEILGEFQRDYEYKHSGPYRSVYVNPNLKYIFAHTDNIVGRNMKDTGKNFSKGLIDAFFELTEKYYPRKEHTGIFFDIGANIGTTAIYVKKLQNPGLRVIGIEVGKENYKVCRANCIINEVDDIEIYHFGFGNMKSEGKYRYFPENPGKSRITKDSAENLEDVKIIRFDDFCNEMKISASEIDYIWMDTEGFESKIIEGGMKILSGDRIPLLHEFNPGSYEDWEKYKRNISSCYSHFVDMDEYIQNKSSYHVYDVDDLDVEKEKVMKRRLRQGDLFFF